MIALALAAALQIGSKQFTESVILAEIAVQTLRAAGVEAEHRREVGGTRVLWEALRARQIDLYPEYTGTIVEELLGGERDLAGALPRLGLRAGGSLGFEDTYAIGMRRAESERQGIRSLSDLARHRELEIGLTNEFLRRRDGWPRLREVYGFSDAHVRGMQHELAYRALRSGGIAATDLYSTDAEIQAGDLVVLVDDRRAFPRYDAVLLQRTDLPEAASQALARLEGAISAREMVTMNARALLERVPEAQVASDFLRERFGISQAAAAGSALRRIGKRTVEHLFLVAVSLAAAIAFAVPLGVFAWRRPRLGQAILATAGVIQTIPSLALLVFMIPLLGIGAGPAIVALFLYSLLPILRGTHAGLSGIAPELLESAEALGLPASAVLRRIELPLAAPSMLSGIKTAAVIDVGTATLGALIGAGGYGQSILTGIRLADTGLILEGAIPAGLMALAVQAVFDVVEWAILPHGLRE
ncbi:MAG TPA: glycine betaine ABC transporter substrate-binding protein [Myxococcales bacterium]|nr:glycine betaine ABC transporter substrate-binding protein [Myxococcales bacterium]